MSILDPEKGVISVGEKRRSYDRLLRFHRDALDYYDSYRWMTADKRIAYLWSRTSEDIRLYQWSNYSHVTREEQLHIVRTC